MLNYPIAIFISIKNLILIEDIVNISYQILFNWLYGVMRKRIMAVKTK